MARLLALPVCLLMLVASLVAGTPTTPFVSHAYNLPWSYLVEAGAPGSYMVLTGQQSAPVGTLASAQYNRSNADLGWDYLKVTFEARDSPLHNGYYAAGYLEGYLTADVILLQGLSDVPSGKSGNWITEHISYMRNQSKALADTDKLWNKVGSLLSLMEGIAAGASAATKTNVTFEQIFMVNFGSEVGDVALAVQYGEQNSLPKFRAKAMPTHCSALIKFTETDLYMAHDTWDVFQGMAYRIHKVYAFGNDPTVVFAAHPAFIASGDDWYQTSNQLAIQETTNDVMNMSLYTAVVPHTVSEFLRVMSATLIANSGEEWTLYFSRENSGTYNNQYMVVDFKLYAPGSSIAPNTLWIAEQLPGMIARGDVSNVLASQGYWASYNIPYFKEIYDVSGYQADFELYGDFYSYTKYARPEIFKRNSATITKLADMQQMMRFNKYQTDPFSIIHNCTGAPNNQCLTPRTSMLSIASRGDLMPTYNASGMMSHYGPLSFFMAQGCFGAIDSKIAAWSQRHTLKAYVISGPTNDDQPTFQWNTLSCKGNPAPAQTPDVVDFPWVEFRIQPDPQ